MTSTRSDQAPDPTGTGGAGPDTPGPRRGRPAGARTRLLHGSAGAVGRHHFAFLRALLDGIGLEQAWRTYLGFSGGTGDGRRAVGQLRQLVDSLGRAGADPAGEAAVAVALPALRALPDLGRRRGRGGAGIPGQDTLAVPAPARPTLDDWRARQCGSAGIDEDFYTEAEWLALYADAFGAAAARQAGAGIPGQSTAPPSPALPATAHGPCHDETRVPAQARLSPMQRRAVFEALATLEQVVARDARLDDPTGLWLAGALPRRLASSGVRTLGDLVDRINQHGFHWYRRVPGLGVVRAQRLVDWLLPVALAAGRPVLASARRPVTHLAPDRLPSARAPSDSASASAAATVGEDGQRVDAWLAQHAGPTHRAYARVTERFLRWAAQVRRRTLATLTSDDLLAYRDFVRVPPADWVQPCRMRRDHPAWRPFQGPLGPASQRQEMAVLASLLGDLHAAGHLPRNPAAGLLRQVVLPPPKAAPSRALSPAQWQFALQVLHEKPDTPARRRLQLLLALAGGAGLRLSELAGTRLQALRRITVDGEPAWVLDVAGRGGRLRAVPIADGVHALLLRHQHDLQAARLDPDASPPVPSPQGQEIPDTTRAQRPLLGSLRRPLPRRGQAATGVSVVGLNPSTQADHSGMLEPSGIDKLLRRFFHGVAREAATRTGAPAADAFLAASSHWLRHSFAQQAAAQLPQPLLLAWLGLAGTRGVPADATRKTEALVRGMRALTLPIGRPDAR